MAKTTENTIETLAAAAEELATNLRALADAGGEAAAEEAVEIPESGDVADLDKAAVAALAVQLGIETEGVKATALRALITTAAAIHHDEDVDDLDADAVTALAEACGIPEGKPAKMLAALKKYLEAAKDTEDAADADEDAEEAPAKSKKAKKPAADDDDDADAEEPAPKAKKGKKAADEDDDAEEDASEDDDAEEEVDPKVAAKRLAAYNKVAKKKLAKYADLAKLLVDGDKNAVAWGTPYIKGDTAYCCGLPLEDVEVEVDGDTKEVGKCKVTNKHYEQDDNGDLVEVEVDAE